jgi:hypothetical protein
MQNGLAVEDLCRSVPDLHLDPLQMGREPALLSASLHTRGLGPTSLQPIAQSGRVLTPRNEVWRCPFGGGTWKGADGDSSHTCSPLRQSPVVSAALSMRGLEV